MKTILKISITLLICLSLNVVYTQTAHAETYTGTWGDLRWTLNNNGILTISGQGEMDDFNMFSNTAWRKYYKEISSVVIDRGVKSIGDWSFNMCSNLKTVTFLGDVSCIGEQAFGSCTNITEIIIPESVETIKDFAFSGCSFETIMIPENVSDLSISAFTNCHNLQSINVDGSNPTYCDIDGVLFDKEVKTILTYPCGREGDYLIPSGVQHISERAFFRCYGLASVSIPEGVKSIGAIAFANCKNMIFEKLPESLESIGGNSFENCYRLSPVTIPSNVTVIGEGAFSGCSSIQRITVDKNNTVYCDIDGVIFDKGQTTIIQYPCGRAGEYTIPAGVAMVGNNAFSGSGYLTNVVFPSSVTSIGESAFFNCSSLTNVTIPDSVTSIGESSFFYCSSLTSVTIPDSVTSIGVDAFGYCSGLTSVTIPDSVTSIGNWAFDACYSLKDVYYSGTREQWKAIAIGSFNDSLAGAVIHYNFKPDFILPVAVMEIEAEAFSGGAFTFVNLPEVCTSIGWHAFSECPNLKYICIPDGCAINDDAFAGVSGLAILGTLGGSVQTWAEEHGFAFIAVD